MKGNKYLAISIFFTILVGVFSFYYSLPIIFNDISFFLGILISTVLILTIILLLKVNEQKSLKDPKRDHLIWSIVLSIIIGAVGIILIVKQKQIYNNQVKNQNTLLEQQSELIESVRNRSMVQLMNNLLNKIDEESRNKPNTLSEETISRIASLSYSFKPYRYLIGDSLTATRLSPERGQLLLSLLKMGIDSLSFKKIKSKTSFEGAMLENADLSNVDLSGANLKYSNMKGADLRDANFNNANLEKVNLWGAKLNNANLNNTNLVRAIFDWADLTKVSFVGANLNGVLMSSANLRNTNFKNSKLNWATLKGSSLNYANLENANLKGADLSNTTINDANFSMTNLELVSVYDSNWLDKLKEWRVQGAKEINEKYKLVDDRYNRSNFLLDKL